MIRLIESRSVNWLSGSPTLNVENSRRLLREDALRRVGGSKWNFGLDARPIDIPHRRIHRISAAY